MLDKILAPNGLRPYSQLIVSVSEHRCQVASLECLSRGPKGTPFELPSVLFDYARQKNAESIVDGHAIEIALDALRLLPTRIGISVNVHASTLGRDPEFVDRLVDVARRNQIECSRITVEIVEHSPAWNACEFLRSIRRMRASNFRIALDDIGIGQSNYRMILDARPDCFKVDSYLVKGAHQDNNRRAILGSIVRLANELGSSVVAEGVETLEDLRPLMDLGITLIQGYLFCRALPTPELLRNLSIFEQRYGSWSAAGQSIADHRKPGKARSDETGNLRTA